MNILERLEKLNKIIGKRGELARRIARLRESAIPTQDPEAQPGTRKDPDLSQAKTQIEGLRRALDEAERLIVLGAWDEVEPAADALDAGDDNGGEEDQS